MGKKCSNIKREGCEGKQKLKNIVDNLWPKTKEEIEEVVNKIWPVTKKELEKGLQNTKKMLEKGERYLKEFSENSVKNTKKLSLSLKKEKLYYDLGKTISNIAKTEWSEDKKVNSLIKELSDLDKEIKSIK